MDIQRAVVITAIAIVSYMMIQAWQRDYANPSIPVAEQTSKSFDSASSVPSARQDDDSDLIPQAQEDTDPEIVTPVAEDTQASRDLISVQTDVMRVEIDPHGGDIVRIALPQYPRSVDNPDQPFTLMERSQQLTYIAQSGLVGRDGTDSADGRPVWRANQQQFSLSDNDQQVVVDLTTVQENGTEITKRYTFERGSYLVRVNHIVNNQSNETWRGALYGQIRRDGSDDPGKVSSGFVPMPTYLGAAFWSEDKAYNKLRFKDMRDSALNLRSSGGWVAMIQHYFLTAWVPDPQSTHMYSSVYIPSRDEYLLRFVSPTQDVSPNSTSEFYAEFYAGPKMQEKLAAISPGLNMTVDYGWLWFISQPIFALLVFLQSGEISIFGLDINIGIGAGNWGIAIILLTLVIKAVFFKLSATSYRSMAKMRKVAPEMQRIKEKYKSDRQKQQMETMKLFKREQINPLGGCLPILVQMPVFIALYYVLLESVELRQAPFFLWINDLSIMDPYFVLPILMGVSMFLQTKLNPTPADPTQAQIMKWMPVIFTVFMLWFPAGLVLYWLTNNILSIAQQWIITRKIEKEGT